MPSKQEHLANANALQPDWLWQQRFGCFTIQDRLTIVTAEIRYTLAKAADVRRLMTVHAIARPCPPVTGCVRSSVKEAVTQSPGKCWLVGSGPGSTDHLTVSF